MVGDVLGPCRSLLSALLPQNPPSICPRDTRRKGRLEHAATSLGFVDRHNDHGGDQSDHDPRCDHRTPPPLPLTIGDMSGLRISRRGGRVLDCQGTSRPLEPTKTSRCRPPFGSSSGKNAASWRHGLAALPASPAKQHACAPCPRFTPPGAVRLVIQQRRQVTFGSTRGGPDRWMVEGMSLMAAPRTGDDSRRWKPSDALDARGSASSCPPRAPRCAGFAS
jgi:hypothetical protein